MRITILTDHFKSWFIPFGQQLLQKLNETGHDTYYVYKATDIQPSDVCFLLSCVRLVPQSFLSLNKNNIVVHASDLPKGKGFSPLQWQIIEGQNQITLTLFEVVEKIDAGPFYIKDLLKFDGTELLPELREKMALKIIDMCLHYVNNYGQIKAVKQIGEESFYRRRRPADDELDIKKTIAEQFNHLRIADNDTYPLYFYYKGKKYILKIYKEEECQK